MFATTSSAARFTVARQPARTTRHVRTYARNDDPNLFQDPKGVLESKAREAKDALTSDTSFTEDAKKSLEPRVAELRDDQLSKGTANKNEVMSFSGPLPELVNGRLAMLGFTACMAAEYFSHRTVFEQIRTAPASIALTFIVIAVASVIPILRGTRMFPDESKEGFGKSGFTVTNELINGRAAMLGFALILFFEAITGRGIFA